jgi:hypothetical protein
LAKRRGEIMEYEKSMRENDRRKNKHKMDEREKMNEKRKQKEKRIEEQNKQENGGTELI